MSLEYNNCWDSCGAFHHLDSVHYVFIYCGAGMGPVKDNSKHQVHLLWKQSQENYGKCNGYSKWIVSLPSDNMLILSLWLGSCDRVIGKKWT